MFGREFEIMLNIMAVLAVIGGLSVLGGIGYGIYKLLTFVFS